ncbi:hypothetical protein [Streptomyces spiralis]|nr:hypothetical protein [Streptomyces spiralis]
MSTPASSSRWRVIRPPWPGSEPLMQRGMQERSRAELDFGEAVGEL